MAARAVRVRAALYARRAILRPGRGGARRRAVPVAQAESARRRFARAAHAADLRAGDPLTLFSAYLQYTHVLCPGADGTLYVGQSTYGDLCLHLGIATGLDGASFPPEYTILPGVMLGYPFLVDALSASMYQLGCDLALSFTLPGTLMMALVYWDFASSPGSLPGAKALCCWPSSCCSWAAAWAFCIRLSGL